MLVNNNPASEVYFRPCPDNQEYGVALDKIGRYDGAIVALKEVLGSVGYVSSRSTSVQWADGENNSGLLVRTRELQANIWNDSGSEAGCLTLVSRTGSQSRPVT